MTTAATDTMTGLERLAGAIEEARTVLREADTACAGQGPALDAAAEHWRAVRAERRAAPDQGATLAQLRALDKRGEDADRALELAEAEARRLTAAREAARKAVREAEQQLVAARRRAEQLPLALRDLAHHLFRRQVELDDARRVVTAIESSIAEYTATRDRLASEYEALTGEPAPRFEVRES